MTFSAYIPTWRGSLALIASIVDAMIMPLFYPAYDGPGVSILVGCFVVLLATITIVVCFHSLRRTRMPDRLASVVSIVFSIWIFYGFVRRAA
jgi:small-conductance mechanosensitive channel